jgi:hypothetical protein
MLLCCSGAQDDDNEDDETDNDNVGNDDIYDGVSNGISITNKPSCICFLIVF